MTESQTEQEVNLNSWAAYTLGHHPNTLRLWHEMLWYDLTYNGPGMTEQSWTPISTEIQEMNAAMRILAREEHVKATVLVELHRVVDQFEVIFEEMVDLLASPEEPDQPMPGNQELWEMGDLASNIMAASEELCAWHRLGAAVGFRQCILNWGSDGDEYQAPQEVKRLQELTLGIPAQAQPPGVPHEKWTQG